MAVNYLGDNGDDGICMGNATTQKIGFYGATPIVKASVAAVTTTRNTTTNGASIAALETALSNLGLITLT